MTYKNNNLLTIVFLLIVCKGFHFYAGDFMKKLSMLYFILCAVGSFEAFCHESQTNIRLIANQQSSYNLVLYINPNCPYCKKVTNYLQSQNRTIPTKNTQDRAIRNELIAIGGKGQVPCLVIDGKALYESDAIIEWIKNHP
jgi:glutaredoxin